MELCDKCGHVITQGNGRTDSKGRRIHRGVSLPYCSNIGCPIGDTVQKNLEIARREIKRDAARAGRDASRQEIQPPNPYDIAVRALEDVQDHTMTGWSTGRHIFEAIKRLMIAADGWDEGWLSRSDDSNKKKEAYRDNK